MGFVLAVSAHRLVNTHLAMSTASDAADVRVFGMDIATLQTSVLVYLGLSSLVFVAVWVVGYLRSR